MNPHYSSTNTGIEGSLMLHNKTENVSLPKAELLSSRAIQQLCVGGSCLCSITPLSLTTHRKLVKNNIFP